MGCEEQYSDLVRTWRTSGKLQIFAGRDPCDCAEDDLDRSENLNLSGIKTLSTPDLQKCHCCSLLLHGYLL